MSDQQEQLTEREAPPIPEYILNACQASAEWWAKSDQDPRIKFQPAIVLRLLEAIRAGNYYEPACSIAGVSYRQFREWMNRAEDEPDNSPFSIMAAAVKVAEAEAEAESVSQVRAAARDPRFWAAGMTFLERRHPDRWKRRDDNQLQVNVAVGIGAQAAESTLRQVIPIVEIRPINALSPALDTAIPLSLTQPTAVSGDNGEAKAKPIGGVSPANVAYEGITLTRTPVAATVRAKRARKRPGGRRRANRTGTQPGGGGGA